MKIRPLLSAATLGLASVIGVAGTGSAIEEKDEKKINSPQPPPKVKLSPLDIPKLIEKKLTISEELFDELLDSSDFNTIVQVFNSLPQEIQIKIMKRAFNEQFKAIKNNSSDLEKKERQVWNLIVSAEKLKPLLQESKPELQNLIGAYLHAIADKENKREKTSEESIVSNTHGLPLLYIRDASAHFPTDLFDEKWHPEIEKIIERLDKEFRMQANAKRYLESALGKLAIVELRSNPKEPKIYNSLLKLIDKNPELYLSSLGQELEEIIVIEATFGNTSRPKFNETLIQPYEKIIQRIVSSPPEENATEDEKGFYNTAWYAAVRLAKEPFHRPGCILQYYDTEIGKIAKAKPESIPVLVNKFQDQFSNYGVHLGIQKEIGEIYKKHLIPCMDTGFQYLLDEDSNKNEIGSRLVISLRDFLSKLKVVNLDTDINFKKSTGLVFNRFQKEELKDEKALRAYLNFFKDALIREPSNTEILKSLGTGLNTQINFTSKTKQAAINPREVLEVYKQEVELLKALNNTMDYMERNNMYYANRIEYAEPLYKLASEKIFKDTNNLEALNEGRELLRKVAWFPTHTKTTTPDTNKECRKFLKETILPMFDSLLANSKNLSSSSKKDFQSGIYKDFLDLFRMGSSDLDLDSGNLFLLNDAIKSINKNLFDLKNENKLEQFLNFTDTTFRKGNFYNWHMPMMVKMLNLQSDYLNSTLKDAGTLLDSPKAKVQLDSLEQLVSYREFLIRIQSQFDDPLIKICTKDEIEKVKELTKTQSNSVNELFVNKLKTVKVLTEKTQTFNHIINEDIFKINVGVIEDIVLEDKTLRNKCLDIVDSRLKIESDPRTRGMLYRTMAKFNPDKTIVLDGFKKAIVIEASPITAKYIGEALGEMVIQELDKNINENLKVRVAVRGLNSRLKELIKTGEVKKYENTPTWNFILETINTTRGRNTESLLRTSGSNNLIQKLDFRKEGEKIDPDVLKAAYQIHKNSNTILAAFVKDTNWEKVNISPYVSEDLSNLNNNMFSLLETNLRWSPPETIPHISAALFDLYDSDTVIDSEKKKNELAEKLFKGTNEKLSIYELLQEGLYSRYIWKHVENCSVNKRNSKEDLEIIQANCNEILRKIDRTVTTKDLSSRKDMWRDLELEIIRLDPKLYSKIVTVPLTNYRLSFLEVFAEVAPSRQRRDYINIVLDRFELRNQISEQDLRRILGLDD